MFFRAMRSQDFDIAELSFSSYLVKHSRGECPYIAVPVFLSRAFRHTSLYARRDRIQRPEDLKGKRIGLPEYQLTANVWARAILQDDYGIRPEDVTWVRGGIDQPGRPEKIKLQLPAGVMTTRVAVSSMRNSVSDTRVMRGAGGVAGAGEVASFITRG